MGGSANHTVTPQWLASRKQLHPWRPVPASDQPGAGMAGDCCRLLLLLLSALARCRSIPGSTGHNLEAGAVRYAAKQQGGQVELQQERRHVASQLGAARDGGAPPDAWPLAAEGRWSGPQPPLRLWLDTAPKLLAREGGGGSKESLDHRSNICSAAPASGQTLRHHSKITPQSKLGTMCKPRSPR